MSVVADGGHNVPLSNALSNVGESVGKEGYKREVACDRFFVFPVTMYVKTRFVVSSFFVMASFFFSQRVTPRWCSNGS